MSESVKFIFKTLIKIPCIIVAIYFIANIFFFSLFYFKFLGVSYSVMNTGMENNYIPPTELSILKKDIEKIDADSALIQGAEIVLNGSNRRQQYGTPINVGVRYRYRWMMPLMPEDYGGVSGYDGLVNGNPKENTQLSQAEIEQRLNERADRSLNSPIEITYKVPGLQYYADLD